jgi:hypothetical protein
MTGSTRAAIEASEVCGQRQAAAEPSPKRHTTIELRPIDVVRDRELIIRYASDLFAISFGESRFKDQFGSDGQGYPAWIADKQAVDPTYAALALLSDVPVGMVVVGAWPDDHAIGYVYHYYLARMSVDVVWQRSWITSPCRSCLMQATVTLVSAWRRRTSGQSASTASRGGPQRGPDRTSLASSTCAAASTAERTRATSPSASGV